MRIAMQTWSKGTVTGAPPLRHIVVPTEHGSWGFLLEPIVLGIAVAPSLAGVLIGLGALGFFLARHPARLASQDLAKRRLYPRTHVAMRFGAAFTLLGAVAILAAVSIAGPRVMIPLACALPLLLVQIWFDLRGGSRQLVAEIAGATAAGALATAGGMAGGMEAGPAFVLWLLMAGRAVPSILYVRARIRIAKGEAPAVLLALASAAAALMVVVLLFTEGSGSPLGVVAFGLLFLRTAAGLTFGDPNIRARSIGFAELGWGLLTLVLLAAGWGGLN